MFLKVGWMYKYGTRAPFAWWSLSWFELDQLSCTLNYYRSPKKNTIKGKIVLDGTQFILDSDKFGWVSVPKWLQKENVFGIIVAKKSITLCCYYSGEKESWIEIMGMFGPEMFNKATNAALNMSKCIARIEAKNAKKKEAERAARLKKDVLETHLPIHTQLYGLNETLPHHHIPRDYTYPYSQVPRFSFNKHPHLAENLKNIANRAVTLLAHTPPVSPSSGGSRRTSVLSERIRMEDALANDAQVNDLLTTLSETKQILGGIEYKQQEQDGHIKLLDSVLSMRSRR